MINDSITDNYVSNSFIKNNKQGDNVDTKVYMGLNVGQTNRVLLDDIIETNLNIYVDERRASNIPDKYMWNPQGPSAPKTISTLSYIFSEVT